MKWVIRSMDLLGLISSCAPMVAPDMMHALVEAESGAHPYAIHDGERLHRPETVEDAIALARRLVDGGRPIRAGLTQMSSREWSDYGLTIETVFEPCPNLRAGERALLEGYQAEPEGIRAQRRAVSAMAIAEHPTESAAPSDAAPHFRQHAPAWAFVPVADGFGDRR